MRSLIILGVLALSVPAAAEIHFTEVDIATLGVDEIAGSPSFVDYNSDGILDFWAGYAYINDGYGNFTKLPESRWGGGRVVCFGDYDNDGYPDILTTRRISVSDSLDTCFILLYRNQGPPDYGVEDVSLGAGLTDTILNRDLVDVAWLDYDSDGWLDFYVSSYEFPVNSAVGHPDYLYHNQGDGTFSDVSVQAGVTIRALCSRGISVGDFDNDGEVDIFVSVYRLQRNILWQNQGDGTFTDVAEEKGVIGEGTLFSKGHNIGACWGDYNNDGYLDLFTPITHHPGYPGDSTNHLWANDGPPGWAFTDYIWESGIYNAEIGSAPAWADYDSDGDLDLYWVNLYGSPGQQSWLYRNDGDNKFTDVSAATGIKTWKGTSYSLWGDINGDGFLDAYIPHSEGKKFFISDAGNDNHWLLLNLQGDTSGLRAMGEKSNFSAIGARVTVRAGDLTVMRELAPSAGNGYGSPFNHFLHFGLGAHEEIDSVVIRWPSGLRERYSATPVDTCLTIIEGFTLGIEESGLPNPVSLNLTVRASCFSDHVIFSVTIPEDTEVRIGIFDAAGRMVAVLEPEIKGDVYEATWQPGELVPAGVYFARLLETNAESVKIIYVR
ncbi:VCBS repeat-containing protein [candidate division WOR-3 bacterium]|nr:VCBS repeat-containing protein [candidate division WOR-3 bacterium]